MGIKVERITSYEHLLIAQEIRKQVFVEEQNVPIEDEIDEYETLAYHYLAFNNDGKPVGTARWRFTPLGYKLERFAVLKAYRNAGIAKSILSSVLKDIMGQSTDDSIYLHAQMAAVPFYEKNGFTIEGDSFWECDIEHVKMLYNSHGKS